MFDRKILKDRAKLVLTRSYFIAFIACIIVQFASYITISISIKRIQSLDLSTMSSLRVIAAVSVVILLILISVALSIFLISPLNVGLKRLMLNLSSGNARLEDLLFAFRDNYSNVVLTRFLKNLIITLWSLPGIIPVIIAYWKFGLADKINKLAIHITGNGSVTAALSLIGITLLLLMLTTLFSFLGIIKKLQYVMADYILADNPSINWRTALNKSKEMMVGNKWTTVKLYFSFIGWYIAANFLCCIGNQLLNPYIEATFAELYIELCSRN